MSMDNMNEIYNKETIDAKLSSLETKIDGHTSVLEDIKIQTTKTNGSVASVTTKLAGQSGYLTGLSVVGGVLVLTVFSVMGYFFIQFVNFKVQLSALKQAQSQTAATISAGVEQGLNAWESNYTEKTVLN